MSEKVRGDATLHCPAASRCAWHVQAERAYAHVHNEITTNSIEHILDYDPGVWVEDIAQTPLLMIVVNQAKTTPTDLALEAFERAARATGG